MITEQELRIGNLLNYNNIAYKVVKIENGFIGLDRDDDFEDYADIKDIDPIALTEDTLLKCGFTKKSERVFILPQGKSRLFYSYQLFLIDDIEFDYAVHIPDFTQPIAFVKGLHNLQNLIFSLTKKELEINL
jgi:hypothetical protein